MSDQQSTQSLHSAEDLGSPTPTEPGADGSLEGSNGSGGGSPTVAMGGGTPTVSTATGTTEIPKPPNGARPDVLLEVDRLVKYFPVRGGLLQRTVAWTKAVDDVSFFIRQGETLGLVGESGCGKTTVGRTLLRLTPATGGEVRFQGQNIFDLKADHLKRVRRDMQIIFQDPFSSLDPRVPIGESIGEGLIIHGVSKNERQDRVYDALAHVGLLPEHAKRYPHEFSGGQRQRIGIARALVLRPKFIVCDEPVSALDVSIQSQVLNILKDLQGEMGLTYLFIAHNLSVVEHISDRVGVMYLGKMAELAERTALFASPQHPYTHALLSAIPIPDPKIRRERIILKGDVPSPLNPPTGCRFHTRCWLAQDICKQQVPEWRNVAPPGQLEHFVACHFAPFTKMPLPGETSSIIGKDETTVVQHQ
ncbi:MAG TPA: oligopeptide/dipeptide ABC transporter ATP-binding protein [Chloroflexia bacterium]|nr:oligopeptide/dipeptide ABC transporter ATP-binding protein [Chloroflexia bacterium]